MPGVGVFRPGLAAAGRGDGRAQPRLGVQQEVRAERRFETRLAGADGEESAALLERERRFDSDLWVVEIETDEIGTLLTLVDQPRA